MKVWGCRCSGMLAIPCIKSVCDYVTKYNGDQEIAATETLTFLNRRGAFDKKQLLLYYVNICQLTLK